jgi:hypothetical protein
LRSFARWKNVPFEEVRKMALENELHKFCARTDRPPRRKLTPAEALARLAAKKPMTPAELKARLDARAQATARRIYLHEQRMRWS